MAFVALHLSQGHRLVYKTGERAPERLRAIKQHFNQLMRVEKPSRRFHADLRIKL